MFEGFDSPASLVTSGKAYAIGTAEVGARERASEPRQREVASGADRARRKVVRGREADRGSRAEAGFTAAKLGYLIEATLFRRVGWRATPEGQQKEEEPSQAGWPARPSRTLARLGAGGQ